MLQSMESQRVRHDLVTKQVLLLEWSNIFYYKVPFPIWEWILINYTIQNICTELQQTNDIKTFWTSIKKVYSRAFWPLKSTFMCGNNKIYKRVLTANGRGLHKCSESITSFKLLNNSIQFSSVQSLSHVWLFETPWTASFQASLWITNSQSLLKLMSIESVMPSNRASHPLLSPFPLSFKLSQHQALFQWVSSG